MAENLSIDRRTSALLVMDFQTLTVDNYAAGAAALLDRTAKLIAAARAAGMRVIYVVVGFRPGYPEVSDRNATFNGLKASGAFAAGAENAKIRRAAGRGNRRHQASGERLRRDRS
jgi:nicotinamidase-related amidase